MRKKTWLVPLVSLLALALAFPLTFVAMYHFSPRPPALTGQLETMALNAGGRERTLAFYRPGGELRRPALVFALHGSNGTGEQMRRLFTRYGFDRLADRERFIVAYPDGYQRHWNDCRISAGYAANTENVDDIAFFRAMIAYFVREQGVDPARVYATGLSNGGHMVYRLAYELPTAFAALAPAAANLPVDANNDCARAGQPVSIALFNGTDDPINPYRGGLVEFMGDASRGEVLSSEDSAAYWAGLAHAVPAERSRYPERDGDARTWIERESWRGDGFEVRLYTGHGSGHLLPLRAPGPVLGLLSLTVGPIATDLDGPAEIWNFFAGRRTQPDDASRFAGLK